VKEEEHESHRVPAGRAGASSQEKETSDKAPAFVWKAIVVVGLIVLVGLVLALKRGGEATGPATPTRSDDASAGAVSGALPRMIEIGSITCIPCKMMAPILDELRKEYAGRLRVDFIDVRKDRGAAAKFGIRVIPTQVFLDAGGKELFRHEGFFPREEIEKQLAAMGVKSKDGTVGRHAHARGGGRAMGRHGRRLHLGHSRHPAEPLPPGQHPAYRRLY